MKKALTLLVLLALALSFSFSSGITETSLTESTEPERIVSLAPNITETIFALNKGEKLIGRTDYCDYPSAVTSIQSIGDLYNPNLELIASIRPDLVIASSIVSPAVVESIRNTGVRVEVINPQDTIDGTYDLIMEVGRLIGSEKEAEALLENIKKRIASVAAKIESISEKRSVYYSIGYGEWGDYTATGDTFTSGIIEAAGAVNIAREGSYWMFDKEALVAADPDVFILPFYSYSNPSGDIAYLQSTPPYSSLTSIRENNIILIDGNLMDRQGPRIADAVESLAELIYPEK